jgi:hypothetical protein
VKEEREPSLLSFKGSREGTVSTLLRLANCSSTTCLQFCIFTWSSDRALTCAVGGPSSFWGPLTLCSLERARSRARLPGATVGVLDTGVSQSTCSWALQRSSFGPGVKRRPKPNKEDPHEEPPHEENDG